MQEFLSKMIGRRIDIFCGGGASLRGDVIKVEGGVLHLRDDDQKTCYVAIDKIAVVWEAREEEHRAGFVSGVLPNNR
ncbi:MAG TPA: MM0924 family protein [Pyrinomonadaceae bacterium]|nr:MM0924 family protein [Pyrinomonadaceae bacterium]